MVKNIFGADIYAQCTQTQLEHLSEVLTAESADDGLKSAQISVVVKY